MRVVSFFAGCGGLDLGFEQAGFQVVWANELEPIICETYIKNHPNTELFLGDINDINPEDIPECDGFIGGPPCQPWSVAGSQRGLDDKRGLLFLKYIDLIKAKRPLFFLIENVKGILDDKFKVVFQDIIYRLTIAGYNVHWKLIDAVNYQVPQNRERVFILGFREELHIKYEFPLFSCKVPITLNQAIGDITELPAKYMGNDVIKLNLQRPNHDVLISDFGQFYYRGNRRRGWQQPSFTIHATADNIPLHPSSPKMLFYGHENWSFQMEKLSNYRRLSVRECARLQTFPDNFIFVCKDIKATYKMIGNAVPPRLSKILAKSILKVLGNDQSKKGLNYPSENILESCTLVGYYKDERHYHLILKNLLYYIRTDGRKGSIFKEECNIMPKFLLLHHKEKATIFELDGNEPVITDGSFLKTLGFNCRGNTYLCFRLKKDQCQHTVINNCTNLRYNDKNYSPFITTLGKIIK